MILEYKPIAEDRIIQVIIAILIFMAWTIAWYSRSDSLCDGISMIIPGSKAVLLSSGDDVIVKSFASCNKGVSKYKVFIVEHNLIITVDESYMEIKL